MSPEQIAEGFANRMSVARRRLGLSQRKVAALMDVDPSFVNHLEAGRRLPSLPNLYALAKLLNVKPKDLLP